MTCGGWGVTEATLWILQVRRSERHVCKSRQGHVKGYIVSSLKQQEQVYQKAEHLSFATQQAAIFFLVFICSIDTEFF